MILNELKITRETYGINKGRYEGKIEYEGTNGIVRLTINAELSKRLLAFIGPTITDLAHKSSLELERNLLQSVEEAKAPIAIESSAQ